MNFNLTEKGVPMLRPDLNPANPHCRVPIVTMIASADANNVFGWGHSQRQKVIVSPIFFQGGKPLHPDILEHKWNSGTSANTYGVACAARFRILPIDKKTGEGRSRSANTVHLHCVPQKILRLHSNARRLRGQKAFAVRTRRDRGPSDRLFLHFCHGFRRVVGRIGITGFQAMPRIGCHHMQARGVHGRNTLGKRLVRTLRITRPKSSSRQPPRQELTQFL